MTFLILRPAVACWRVAAGRSLLGRSGAGILLGLFALAQEPGLREAARLDAAGKCEAAEPYYRQALATGRASPALLNNAGNHYLICGRQNEAARHFLALLKINPAHPNANLQMGRIAVERGQGAVALTYLTKVKEGGPAVQLLRAEALQSAGRPQESEQSLQKVRSEAAGDPRILFSVGVSAARMGRYEIAEAAFSDVATRVPGNFEVLFNLGRAASRGKHFDRAASVLEGALKLKPGDPGALLELGLAYAGQQEPARAVFVLAQARLAAPKDAEILLALARSAEAAGFLGDSALAFDEYLVLRPKDDRVRLERARVLCLTNTRAAEGLEELSGYLKRHPEDANAHFIRAQFTWETNPDLALTELTNTIRLDAGFAPAYFARAWLLQRLGRGEQALSDLQATVRLAPGNVRALDRLGLAYLSLDRATEAEKPLLAALSISPNDREVLMHLGRVLVAQDREAEARKYFELFRAAPVQQVRDPRQEAGMIELATLSAGEGTRRQIERLKKQAADHPNQPELQLRLAQLLLTAKREKEAEDAFRELATRNADPRIWEAAGISLAKAERYSLAIEFLKRSLPAGSAVSLELAGALSWEGRNADALEVLEAVPATQRYADYFLVKAKVLEDSGRNEEAERALQSGLALPFSRPQAAQQAAVVLVARDRMKEALDLVEQAVALYPASPDLALTRAIVLGVMDRSEEAERAFRAIQSRWPEWGRPYFAYGLLLEKVGRKGEARKKMKVAVALNLEDQGALCGLARLEGSTTPDAGCSCGGGLRQLLESGCAGA